MFPIDGYKTVGCLTACFVLMLSKHISLNKYFLLSMKLAWIWLFAAQFASKSGYYHV